MKDTSSTPQKEIKIWTGCEECGSKLAEKHTLKCSKNITKAIKLLKELLATLKKNMNCMYWACPGSEKPFEDMATCYRCYQIQEIERFFKNENL